MALYELRLPKMGESVFEATILSWTKEIGDTISTEDTVVEVATDKVDTEVPSPVDGVLKEVKIAVNEVALVGQVIALIETSGESNGIDDLVSIDDGLKEGDQLVQNDISSNRAEPENQNIASVIIDSDSKKSSEATAILSPLVRNIAKKEGVSIEELNHIKGSGAQGRVTKEDLLSYISSKESQTSSSVPLAAPEQARVVSSGSDEILELTRMQKLTSQHMVKSKQTAPHVTSFVEADVTNAIKWRTAKKEAFQSKYGFKLTFTPILVEAVARACQKFPKINSTLDGDNWVIKNDINIGMATALPDGNLIVPVIRQADRLSLIGLAEQVNQLGMKARNNQLAPFDIQNGTITISNVGTFGNLTGTPIIPQPQSAILAAGLAKKKPAVVETEYGDMIAIRHIMILSMSYDHRIINGYLGGSFLKEVADQLEAFDPGREV